MRIPRAGQLETAPHNHDMRSPAPSHIRMQVRGDEALSGHILSRVRRLAGMRSSSCVGHNTCPGAEHPSSKHLRHVVDPGPGCALRKQVNYAVAAMTFGRGCPSRCGLPMPRGVVDLQMMLSRTSALRMHPSRRSYVGPCATAPEGPPNHHEWPWRDPLPPPNEGSIL